MRRPLGTYDGNVAQVGDTVYVRATVRKVVRSEELLVTFLSKTTEYEELVRTDLCELDLPDLCEEPPDGTMLECRAPDGTPQVFKRDDTGSADHAARRYARRWWSYVDQKWVDWPYVVSRGGLDAQVLTRTGTPQEPGGEPAPADPLDAVGISRQDADLLADILRGCDRRTIVAIAKMVRRRVSRDGLRLLTGRHLDGLADQRIDQVLIHGPLMDHLYWRVDRGDMEWTKGVGDRADRWTWIHRSG